MGQDLHLRQGVGIGELPGEVGNEARRHDAGRDPQDGLVGFLVGPAGVRGQPAHHRQGHSHQQGAAEARPEPLPGAPIAIHRRQDVAEDVTDGEEEGPPIEGERSQVQDLAGSDVADAVVLWPK